MHLCNSACCQCAGLASPEPAARCFALAEESSYPPPPGPASLSGLAFTLGMGNSISGNILSTQKKITPVRSQGIDPAPSSNLHWHFWAHHS